MDARSLARGHVLDYVALVKPRILVMSVATAVGGMVIAPGSLDLARLVLLSTGTAFMVGAANAFNMWMERDVDALMARTKHRPLPAGRLSPDAALGFGAALGATALPLLMHAGSLAPELGVIGLVLYAGVYTPMKRRSHHAVWVGAIAGAVPVLMGWSTQTGTIDGGGSSLFAILFAWQIPHAHAIGMYRQREYRIAGLRTLAATRGQAAAERAIGVWLVVQVVISFIPLAVGLTGHLYMLVAFALGTLVLVQGFTGRDQAVWPHRVFTVSLVYLPVIVVALAVSARWRSPII